LTVARIQKSAFADGRLFRGALKQVLALPERHQKSSEPTSCKANSSLLRFCGCLNSAAVLPMLPL